MWRSPLCFMKTSEAWRVPNNTATRRFRRPPDSSVVRSGLARESGHQCVDLLENLALIRKEQVMRTGDLRDMASLGERLEPLLMAGRAFSLEPKQRLDRLSNSRIVGFVP